MVVTVCKFDENRLVVVDPDGLILIEEVIALSSLVRKLVELRPPVDAPEVVKAALVEDPRLEGVTKLLRDTEDSVRAGVVGLLPGSVVLLIRDIVDDDIVAEVTGEPCGLESSVVGLVVDSETKDTEVETSAWELLVVVDTRRRDVRVLDGLSAGLTMPVACTLEAQASAAIAPTNT